MDMASLVTDSKIGFLYHTGFLHAGINPGKLKVDSKIFGRTWSKMAGVI